MYMNRACTQFLFLMTFITPSLSAMEPEKPHYDLSTLPKEVFLQICVKRDDKQPWQPLKHIARFKTVCKNWCAMIPDHKAIADMLRIPPMHYAAAMGYADEIVRLKLKEKHSVREPDENMFSPCDYAAGMKQLKSLKILNIGDALKDEFIPPVVVIDREYTAQDLTNALIQGNQNTVETMLLKKATQTDMVNWGLELNWSTSSGWNTQCRELMLYMIQSNLEGLAFRYLQEDGDAYHNDFCELFKEYHADPNVYEYEGMTLLQAACAYPTKVSIVQFLLECKGIDVNRISKKSSLSGLTAIHAAVYRKNTKAIEMILATKACNVNALRYKYGTALHDAATRADAKLLIDHNADLYSKNTTGGICETPLHSVAFANSFDVLSFFATIPGCHLDIKDGEGKTPLYYAVLGNSLKCMHYLLDKKADISIKSMKGENLLHAAARGKSVLCAPSLLSIMPDAVNSTNNWGETPLHYAAQTSPVHEQKVHVDIVKQLIAAGASVNKPHSRGGTPMHSAALNGQTDVISELFKHRAHIDGTYNADAHLFSGPHFIGGFTPLHCAAFNGFSETFKKLVECNADVTTQTASGKTAFDIAKEREPLRESEKYKQGYTDIVEFLSSCSADEKSH
jgi:ankyrin repeat protein